MNDLFQPKLFQIYFSQKHDLSYRLNTLHPLCLWQRFTTGAAPTWTTFFFAKSLSTGKNTKTSSKLQPIPFNLRWAGQNPYSQKLVSYTASKQTHSKSIYTQSKSSQTQLKSLTAGIINVGILKPSPRIYLHKKIGNIGLKNLLGVTKLTNRHSINKTGKI